MCFTMCNKYHYLFVFVSVLCGIHANMHHACIEHSYLHTNIHYIYAHTYMHAYIHTYTHAQENHGWNGAPPSARQRANGNLCVLARLIYGSVDFLRVYVCICVYTHTYTYGYIYIYIYTYIYIYIYILFHTYEAHTLCKRLWRITRIYVYSWYMCIFVLGLTTSVGKYKYIQVHTQFFMHAFAPVIRLWVSSDWECVLPGYWVHVVFATDHWYRYYPSHWYTHCEYEHLHTHAWKHTHPHTHAYT
jgi:hypothetical protein